MEDGWPSGRQMSTAAVDGLTCPGRSAARSAALLSRGPCRMARDMGPGSAAQRHSASKTRVNALMALHRVRDTCRVFTSAHRWHNRAPGLGDSCCNCNRRSACWRCWPSRGRSVRTAARFRCGKARSGLPSPSSPRWCCSSCRRWQRRSAPSTTPSTRYRRHPAQVLHLCSAISAAARCPSTSRRPARISSWRFRRCRSSWS